MRVNVPKRNNSFCAVCTNKANRAKSVPPEFFRIVEIIEAIGSPDVYKLAIFHDTCEFVHGFCCCTHNSILNDLMERMSLNTFCKI